MISTARVDAEFRTSSTRMIAIARGLHPDMDFRVDDCSELRTIDDGHCDLVIANYVLMDTSDLRATVAADRIYGKRSRS